MKNLLLSIGFALSLISCKSLPEISPKDGAIVVQSKQNITLWNDDHRSFNVILQNKNTKNSCEVYTVKHGVKKWISPSLLANKSLDFVVSSNSSVLIENFSDENVEITYTVK